MVYAELEEGPPVLPDRGLWQKGLPNMTEEFC